MPIWDGFLRPVLEVLESGEIRRNAEIYKLVAHHLGIPDDQMAETLPSGQLRFENRVGWALSSLFKAELLDKPSGKGRYQINDRGRRFLAEHPGPMNERTLIHALPVYKRWFEGSRSTAGRTPGIQAGGGLNASPETTATDPRELIEAGYAELRKSVAADLLKRLKTTPPTSARKRSWNFSARWATAEPTSE